MTIIITSLSGEPRAASIRAVTNVIILALDKLAFDSLMGPLKELLDVNMISRILKNLKWFENLSHNMMRDVAKAFKMETFQQGDVIIKEGEMMNKLYIINEGNLKVSNAKSEVGEYHAGSFFGQKSLLDDEKRKYTIRADTKTEVFTIDKDTFELIIGIENYDSLKVDFASTNMLVKAISVSFTPHSKYYNSDKIDRISYKFANLKFLALLGSGTLKYIYVYTNLFLCI